MGFGRFLGWIEDRQLREEFSIEAPVSGEETRGHGRGVSADHEIGQDSRARSPLLPVEAPGAAREEVCFTTQALHAEIGGLQKSVAVFWGIEMAAEFGVYDIADYEGAFGSGRFKSVGRSPNKILIGPKDVEQLEPQCHDAGRGSGGAIKSANFRSGTSTRKMPRDSGRYQTTLQTALS